jgi:hypothetical protein
MYLCESVIALVALVLRYSSGDQIKTSLLLAPYFDIVISVILLVRLKQVHLLIFRHNANVIHFLTGCITLVYIALITLVSSSKCK